VVAADGDLDLPHGLALHARGKTAWLRRRAPGPGQPPRLERVDVPGHEFDLACWRTRAGPAAVALDASRLEGAVVRPLAPLDRFAPLGGSGRAVRVVDWLARQGLPAFVRRTQWVLATPRGVAWVIGRRPDLGHAVGEGTRVVACWRIEGPARQA
ncbi:MAG: hypothetical protein O2894_04200, partial [Planctomycetota bacterium]|nr:hypothetical protein [Planctomycetota bacterium]